MRAGNVLGKGAPEATSTAGYAIGCLKDRTNSAWEHRLVVDIALDPCHKVFNVLWSRHLCWPLEVLRVLPQILESRNDQGLTMQRMTLLYRLTHPWPSSPDMIEESKTPLSTRIVSLFGCRNPPLPTTFSGGLQIAKRRKSVESRRSTHRSQPAIHSNPPLLVTLQPFADCHFPELLRRIGAADSCLFLCLHS